MSSGTPLDHFLGETWIQAAQVLKTKYFLRLPLWWTVHGGLQLAVTLSSLATVSACHPATTGILFSCIPLLPMHKHELTFCFPCRSSQGFMHMKLMKTKEKYILGQNSPPFDSVPEVIHYYTIKKLPIKGAEHLSLLYPVAVRTL